MQDSAAVSVSRQQVMSKTSGAGEPSPESLNVKTLSWSLCGLICMYELNASYLSINRYPKSERNAVQKLRKKCQPIFRTNQRLYSIQVKHLDTTIV